MHQKNCLSIAMIALALGTAACVRYHARPLTDAAVNSALTPPRDDVLRVMASQLHHPLLPHTTLDPRGKLTPDGAAILAVLLNPSLRAARDQRQAAQAQLLQAGILPNPQLSYNEDFVTGGNTQDTFNAYGLGVSWEVTSLITRNAKIKAAQAQKYSVDLDIAWQEWQIAEGAKMAWFDLAALEQQIGIATQIDGQLAKNVDVLHQAVERHQKSILDLAAADAASRDAHATLLALMQQRDHQLMMLRRAIGLPADAALQIATDPQPPMTLTLPSAEALLNDLPARRLDLVALKWGYASQEETLRAAILAQFPKISLGYNQASDTSNVHTSGVGITVDLPIFDRNQGVIAQEKATRRQLYDEYTSRVFEARLDVATALSDIRDLTRQISTTQASLASLQHLVDVYKLAYDRGNADVVSYYTAISDLLQKTLDLARLRQQLWDNQIALELAAGWYLPSAPAATQPLVNIPPATEPRK